MQNRTASLLLALSVGLYVSGCGGGSPTQLTSDPQTAPTVSVATATPVPTATGCPSCAGEGAVVDEPWPSTVKGVAAFKIYAASEKAPPQFYDGDNRPVSNQDFMTAFKRLSQDPNAAIELQVVSQDPAKVGKNPRAISVGCIWMDVRWDTSGYVPCIKRNGAHLNFHIRNKCSNREIFNLHCMGWKDNGPQFGLYESASGKCFSSPGTWTAIRDRFMGAFAVVGITGATAYVLSNAATGVTVAAFAL